MSHLLKILCSLAFAFHSVIVHGQTAPACYAPLVQQCETLNTSYKNSLTTASAPNASTALWAGANGAALQTAGTSAQTAAVLCASLDSQCAKACEKDESEQKVCQQKIAAAAARMRTEGTGFSISGSDMAVIAGLMGATAGIGATFLSKGGSNSSSQAPNFQQQASAQATGALQLDGSLQCAFSDSYKYADCNTYLVSACTPAATTTTTVAQQTPVTGAVIQTPSGASTQVDCPAFTTRYCSSTTEAATGMGYHLPNGTVTQVNLAGSGEGYATPFCQKAWCNADGANAACPMCQQLNSTTCQANPAACLEAGTSTVTSCQGFPQATPANGGSAVAQVPSVPADGTSTPAAGTQSLPSVASQLGTASVASELIAPGGVLVQRDPASSMPVAGPATDVVGLYGPSLFATSSRVMQQRCQVGQLNCP